MSTLTKVLEQARALQIRNGVSAREALALAMATQRRTSRMADAIRAGSERVPFQTAMPAASCLDAMLPRDREPTVAEIRDAWNECVGQSILNAVHAGNERGDERANMLAAPCAENQ